jgi:DNA repair protein NreA
MVTPTPEMCLACKGGRNLCGEPCMLLAKIDRRLPQLRVTSQDLQGTSPPSVFVGRYGYPHVSAGPLLPPLHLERETAARLEDPQAWMEGSIQDVLGMRSSLLRTRANVRVHDARRPPPILSVTQELALAARPVDTEVHLVKKPNLALTARVDDTATAMGPSVEADRARLVENAPVPRLVDRLFDDVDAKAATSVTELYEGGLTPYRIQPLLSLGLLGRAAERKLVPTRWSITATDDMLGRQLIPQVLDSPGLDRVEVYEGRLHGNEFHVFLLPMGWSYDMIEVWIKGSMWALETSPFIEDWEDWRGRKGYASHITGAYYAARLSVLEHLSARRRQAGVFVYREITPDYWAPLGVWVIREAVRRTLESKPILFDTTADAIAYVEPRTRQKGWARASKLLSDLKGQTRLHEFA